MTILEANNLKLKLGNNQILKNVNLTVADGDRIGLVGPNGAGKTTLARIIRGELEPDSGQLYWHRNNIRVGYLEQEVRFDYDSLADLWQEEADSRTACESRIFAVRSRAEEMARENKKSRILSQISSLKARQNSREHEEEIAGLEEEYRSLIEGK